MVWGKLGTVAPTFHAGINTFIAADQDPEFRKYFYRELLPHLKAKGKTVIAVTHDDHYFDVADKVIKLDYGLVNAADYGKMLTV